MQHNQNQKKKRFCNSRLDPYLLYGIVPYEQSKLDISSATNFERTYAKNRTPTPSKNVQFEFFDLVGNTKKIVFCVLRKRERLWLLGVNNVENFTTAGQ